MDSHGNDIVTFILIADFWLLNTVFQRRLSPKALSKGKPKAGPLGQDSLP